MIDRLVHHAEVLTLTGDSYRTRQRRELLAKETRNGGAISSTAPTAHHRRGRVLVPVWLPGSANVTIQKVCRKPDSVVDRVLTGAIVAGACVVGAG